ncbi:MAG: hypothetical protein R3199_03870 [Gemmatimonadota bacterium]|nr:hypothetical protein [Gemmatimonadota bacterium]
MDRRTFLHAIGAGTPLWLAALADPTRTSRSSTEQDEAPRCELSRCDACGELKGVAAAANGSPKIATCRCEPSLCGRCGEVIHPRKICGHYWCEERQALIHVPWFAGMKHSC